QKPCLSSAPSRRSPISRLCLSAANAESLHVVGSPESIGRVMQLVVEERLQLLRTHLAASLIGAIPGESEQRDDDEDGGLHVRLIDASPTLCDPRSRGVGWLTHPGYYKTADAGYFDENGYVFVMAWTDDIIYVAVYRL